jgi:hypothetical protein
MCGGILCKRIGSSIVKELPYENLNLANSKKTYLHATEASCKYQNYFDNPTHTFPPNFPHELPKFFNK